MKRLLELTWQAAIIGMFAAVPLLILDSCIRHEVAEAKWREQKRIAATEWNRIVWQQQKIAQAKREQGIK